MEYPEEYDRWYDDHPFVLMSELEALRLAADEMIDSRGRIAGKGLEVGGGTGRFALELGIDTVIEPSAAMGGFAEKRGLKVVRGYAEQMPFADDYFDLVLFVTSLCFIKNSDEAIKESNRVLKIHGSIIIGMINPHSPSGRSYVQSAGKTIQSAKKQSVKNVIDLLEKNGFTKIKSCQTIFEDPERMEKPSDVRSGYESGVFVVISGIKSERS